MWKDSLYLSGWTSCLSSIDVIKRGYCNDVLIIAIALLVTLFIDQDPLINFLVVLQLDFPSYLIEYPIRDPQVSP